MKLLSSISLSCLFLVGCGSGNSSDNRETTVYGSKENGYAFTVVSKNGYHAVRLNNETWHEVSGELNLSDISNDDKIEIIELCEENEYQSYNSAASQIHNLDSLRYRINNEDRLIKHCYKTTNSDNSSVIEDEYSFFTLFSQQENEGIEIQNVRFSEWHTVNYDNSVYEYGINLNELGDQPLSIFVTGYNSDLDNYYLYHDDSFNFSNGDMISLDFYSENSYLVNHINIEENNYEYYLDYCYEDYYINCFDLSINYPVQVRLELPIELQTENGTYHEMWSLYLENGGRFSYRVDSLENNNENLIDKNIDTLASLNFTALDEDIVLNNFSLNGFQPSEWYLSSETKYENFRLRSYNYINANEIKFSYINLEDIPNPPLTFRQSSVDIESAEISLNAGIYDFEESSPTQSQYMDLTISIPLEYIQ